MNDLFPRTNALRLGYKPEQVAAFFDEARLAYERPGSPDAEVSQLDVRRAAFDLKHGGYSTAAVDAALDRLELAFAERTRDIYVRAHSREEWMAHLAERAQVLYPRLRRPVGERFAHPATFKHGYDVRQVDAVMARITEFFDTGAPLEADELRAIAFSTKTGTRAYDERTVDAFIARTVDILLGVIPA
ncbi:DivIVA domain-containing protein [Demequina aurantiaca]|uniref:DivIVA domain-containing protein n=1 Tax=Demequina aurantiaca TaxID=676200 RepID=UPI0007809F84|nr:DivIVA domain-containing protein [Demequina aurantiaca]